MTKTLRDAKLPAGLRAAELNAAERVRDASPALLAACEAARRIIEECDITWAPDDFESVVAQIEAAIKAAKGTG